MAVLIAVYLGDDPGLSLRLAHERDRFGQQQQQGLRAGRGRRLLRAPARTAGRRGRLDPGHVLDVHLAQRQRPDRPASLFRDGPRRALPGRTLPGSPRFQTPANAILAQGIWAIILTLAGTFLIVVPPTVAPGCPRLILAAWKKLNETPLYDLLYTYVIFGANIFYMLAISSVFVLRVRQPDLPRPYRTWGYPFTPLLYVAAALLLLGNMLADHQSRVQSLAGIGIILLGLPAYWLFRRNPAEVNHGH